MKLKLFKSVLACLILAFTCNANAGLIKVEDWHLTSDEFGGLRQHDDLDNVFYAVSSLSRWDASSEYETIQGYHFATYDEYMSIIDSSGITNWSTEYHYRDRGGWNGYRPPGESLNHVLFRFADTTLHKRVVHAGQSSGVHSYVYQNADTYSAQAGFIMIKNQVINAVPEPSTLAIFALGMIGLLSCRFKR